MSDDAPVLSGHKKVGPDNFRDDDPVIAVCGMPSALGPFRRMTSNDWVQLFTATSLSHKVPQSIQDLHTVAKSISAYGVLYYPLFAKGMEEAYRTADAACKRRCADLGNGRGTFEKRIERLHLHGLFSSDEQVQWTAFRKLRNASSHADAASVWLPGPALGIFREVTGAINRLYSVPTGDVRLS